MMHPSSSALHVLEIRVCCGGEGGLHLWVGRGKGRMVLASWQQRRGKWILMAPPAVLLLSLEHQSKVDF